MNITDIQINLTDEEIRQKDHVQAFVRIVFDDNFAVRDLKVMEDNGFIWLGMPSRKLWSPCPSCRRKVDIAGNYCSNCGMRFKIPDSINKRSYVDIAHPVNKEFRHTLDVAIASAYNKLVDSSSQLKVRPIDVQPERQSAGSSG